MKFFVYLVFGQILVTSVFASGCSISGKVLEEKNETQCKKQVVEASVKKLMGSMAPEVYGDYVVNKVKNYGLLDGHKSWSLYSVSITDEADGSYLISFVDKESCEVKKTVYGTDGIDH